MFQVPDSGYDYTWEMFHNVYSIRTKNEGIEMYSIMGSVPISIVITAIKLALSAKECTKWVIVKKITAY